MEKAKDAFDLCLRLRVCVVCTDSFSLANVRSFERAVDFAS